MKVLLVDDYEPQRDLVSGILRDHDLVLASDLEEGLTKLAGGDFDVLITDWNLGERSTPIKLVDEAISMGIKVVIRTGGSTEGISRKYRDTVQILPKGEGGEVELIRRSVER